MVTITLNLSLGSGYQFFLQDCIAEQEMIEKNYKGLFVTDLDGTLLTDDKRVSSHDLETLMELQERNIATVIATGRSDYSFFKLTDSLGALGADLLRSVDAVIFSTGAGILAGTRQELLKSYSLSEKDVYVICACLESLGVDYMVHQAIPETVHFSYRQISSYNNDFCRRIELYKDYAVPLSMAGHSIAWSGRATEVLSIIPGDEDGRMAKRIAEELRRFSVIRATSPLDHRSTWVEIFSPSVSKSSAVGFIARAIGLSRQQVCAVGNDYNDQDLLSYAAAGYLVANGPASLKHKFLSVPSNNHSGVSAAAGLWMETSRF